MIQRRQFLTQSAVVAGALASTAALPVWAQEHLVRLVVGYPAGGSSDRVARIVADKLQTMLRQPVIVENKVGAGGRVAAQYVKNAPASQPMLMLANPAVMVVAPLVMNDVGYDAARDFVPVSEVNSYVFGVAVSSAVPVKELKHLLAWFKANPNQANIGVPATGSLPHFFALMLGQKAQVNAEAVGYKGSAPLVTDLIGGQIPAAVDTLDVLLPQFEAGKLRLLAVSSEQRHPLAPQVPTLMEAGVNLAASGWNTFFAPRSMPVAQVERYETAIRAVMQDPETVRQFKSSNLDPVVATAAQTRQRLAAYRQQWEPVIRESGYRP